MSVVYFSFLYRDFTRINQKTITILFGLSIGSLFLDLAWFLTTYNSFLFMQIQFPIMNKLIILSIFL